MYSDGASRLIENLNYNILAWKCECKFGKRVQSLKSFLNIDIVLRGIKYSPLFIFSLQPSILRQINIYKYKLLESTQDVLKDETYFATAIENSVRKSDALRKIAREKIEKY